MQRFFFFIKKKKENFVKIKISLTVNKTSVLIIKILLNFSKIMSISILGKNLKKGGNPAKAIKKKKLFFFFSRTIKASKMT